MNNTEILEQILLAIDDKRQIIYLMQNYPTVCFNSVMDDIYTAHVPDDIKKKINCTFSDKSLIKIFGKGGVSAIRDAQKAAILKAKEERKKLLLFSIKKADPVKVGFSRSQNI